MRILVLSDSHGCVEPMEQCVERVQPQVILHLGDCVRDAQRLEERYPQIPLLGVPGNCDYGGLDQPERLTELGGVRILMMHGHTRRVKSGPHGGHIRRPGVRGGHPAVRPHPTAGGGPQRRFLGDESRVHRPQRPADLWGPSP